MIWLTEIVVSVPVPGTPIPWGNTVTTQGVTRERTGDNVREFWEETADRFQLDPTGTIRDRNFQELEIAAVREVISGSERVLDIGCGNGYATVHYAQDVGHITGMDYVDSFVRWARRSLENFSNPEFVVGDNIEFQVGDVTAIPGEDSMFDAVVGARVLINLTERELQKKAITEIARVLQPGGLYVCVEVTEQGHAEVNRYREMFGLESLERYWHNFYLDEPSFFGVMSEFFELSETRRFGMYQFLSKVLHPLLVAPEEPRFDSKLNAVARRIAEQIPEFETCSHQVMYVFRKR